MQIYFALAPASDSGETILMIVMISIGIIAVVGIMAGIPVFMARRRRHRQARIIGPLLVLWAFLTCCVGISFAVEQVHWSANHQMLIESGYYDPASDADPPPRPWTLGTAMIAIYAALWGWVMMGGGSARGRARLK